MRYQIQCNECDSEYNIDFEEGLLSDEPQFCSICKESIDPELIPDDE